MATVHRNSNWLRRATGLDVCLVLVPLFAYSAAVLVEVPLNPPGSSTPTEYKFAASNLWKKIKSEIEPCQDFYQFACGNFIDKTEIPAGREYVDSYAETANVYRKQITEILMKQRPDTEEPKHFKFPNAFFNACMNTELIENLGIRPLTETANSLGGWPVVVGSSWDSNNSWTWIDLVKKLRRVGFSSDYIIKAYISEDFHITRNIINLYPPTFVFEEDIYTVSRELYFDFMVEIAIRFGANKATAKKELRKSLKFEKALVHILTRCDNEFHFYNLRSIKQFQAFSPKIQWLDFINALLPEGHTVDENEVVNFSAPSFFNDLGKLLARTDKRVIANYMMWKFHYFSLSFLPGAFRKKRLIFDSIAKGTLLMENRLNDCLTMALDSFPISTGSLYIQKYFTITSKRTAADIFENIRDAFNKTLDESQWLDDATKKEAQRKLYSLKAVIGFPDEMFDNNKIEDYYRELDFDPNKYFQSYLNISAFNLDRKFDQLRLALNETDWLRSADPYMVGASTVQKRNKIHIPAAALQGESFNSQRPNYMNYGFVGSTIGHEIMHGFYGLGCWYDADCKQGDWWQPISMQALSERANCLIEQYGNYTDQQTGLKIDGFRTREENIADNSGIKFSYLAYKQWVARHGEEVRLPDLKYSPEQTFWISFAQKWCINSTPEAKRKFITTSVHALNEFRVLGTLRNMKEFSRDFHCPEDSPMNPLKKCEVW